MSVKSIVLNLPAIGKLAKGTYTQTNLEDGTKVIGLFEPMKIKGNVVIPDTIKLKGNLKVDGHVTVKGDDSDLILNATHGIRKVHSKAGDSFEKSIQTDDSQFFSDYYGT